MQICVEQEISFDQSMGSFMENAFGMFGSTFPLLLTILFCILLVTNYRNIYLNILIKNWSIAYVYYFC